MGNINETRHALASPLTAAALFLGVDRKTLEQIRDRLPHHDRPILAAANRPVRTYWPATVAQLASGTVKHTHVSVSGVVA